MRCIRLTLVASLMALCACHTDRPSEAASDRPSGDKAADATVKPLFPELAKDITIYEVNIRQHTKEGTFKAFQNDLPRLKKLGVGMLWIMPIQPIGEKNRKGTRGSYYS